MPPFAPTQEQFRVFDTIISGTHPVVVINAGPGCAKTTTLIETVKLLERGLPAKARSSDCDVIYTAFNKDIVKETNDKFFKALVNRSGAYKVDCATFNALGLRIWRKRTTDGPSEPPIRLNLNKNKDILRWIQDQGRYSISPEEWPDLSELMRLAKSQGWLPPGSGSAFKSLLDFKSLCSIGDIRPAPTYELILDLAMRESIRRAFAGEFDFDDQLYMTALFAGNYPKGPRLVMVDECQDLTPVQLFLLRRIKATQTVLVGDPFQAIYGFRGAMSDTFKRIQALWPDAAALPLMTSFRVPQATLLLLRERCPELQTNSGIKGRLDTLSEPATIPDLLARNPGKTAAILCRNNAPLYRAALACIASKVPFGLSDHKWGEAIIRDIKRVVCNPLATPVDVGFIREISTFWLTRAGEDPRAKSMAADKIAALENLIEITHPVHVGGLILTLDALLKKATGGVLLSTAHKAKGLEFDFVVHLDPDLIPNKWATTAEALAQEHNIAYVINSRTRNHLMFAESLNLIIPGVPQPKRNPARKERMP